MVECHPSKVKVASSSLVSRSMNRYRSAKLIIQMILITNAHIAQSVERILGKDEVSSSTLLVGSNMK